MAPNSATDNPISRSDGPSGVVPSGRGANFSLNTTSQHDSSNGWSSILGPNVAYRFNARFSIDAGTPIYSYINGVDTTGTKAKPIYTNATKMFIPGDTFVNFHFTPPSDAVGYGLTATLGLPSGDTSYGLGAGQPTYSVSNHFEHSLAFLTPEIEVGVADNSSLVNTRVRKSYTTVGNLGIFQAGLSLDILPKGIGFSADAYEDLPINAQTLYSTTGKGKKKVTTATGKSLGEDNGFETSLDIPLSPNSTLSGFYNRSLRGKIDTAGFSFTFFLRPANHESLFGR